MKDKKLVFYTLYKEDEKNGDLINIINFDSIDQVANYLKIKKRTIYNRLQDKKKLLDKYIIYKDYININDLI